MGHSVHTGCDITTFEQMIVREGLGREESVLVEGTNILLPKLTSELQHKISFPSVASQAVGQRPNISNFSGDLIQKEEVSFKQ